MKPDRTLERALLVAFVLHAFALLGETAWLVSAGPAWLRFGSVACIPRALGDVFVAVAMLRVRWFSRAATVSAAALTLVAVPMELDAVIASTLRTTLPSSSFGWATVLAALAASAWAAGVGGARHAAGRSRYAAVALAAAAALLALGGTLVHGARPSLARASFVAQSVVLTLFFALLAELVLARARPDEPYGRLARWRHPSGGILARMAEVIANSRLAGALLEPLPELEMRSDISDVVYVNYLVPADVAERIVPEGLELQRLGPDGKWALFSFLTYRHGHFGFALLGPLRKLFPSPIQTNWRIHVTDPFTARRGVYFLSNAVSATLIALAARMLTEGMPMHVLRHAAIVTTDDGEIRVTLDPGRGSAPDAELRLHPAPAAPRLEGAWAECWDDFRSFLAYCVPQNRALSSQPLRRRVSRQEIELGIPLDACEPLEGSVDSRLARSIAADATPLCFRVPHVRFSFSKEAHDRRV